MDLTQLHTESKKACKSAYEDFKHYINNPIFHLSDKIIEIHIDELKMKTGMKVYKWYLNNHTFSEKQFKIVDNVKNSYLDITLKYALNYSNKK